MVTSGFFRGERFVPQEEIPDLERQVYIVTGGSKGIGFGIVRHLLARNAAKIIILSSSEESASKAIQDLKKYGDTSRVTWRKCDLKNLKQVDEVAMALRDEEPRLDALILNAGIGVAQFSLSHDGLDNHFQINALSQLHLALMLLPKLRRTSALSNYPSRLIMMSSEMHRFAPRSTKFQTIEEINTDVGSARLYSRSKLAQILLIREMADRISNGQLGFEKTGDDVKQNILVNATHPGGVKTAQQEQLVPAWGWFGWLIMWLIRPVMVDPVDIGCLSALFASTPTKGLLKDGGLHGQYIVPDKKVSQPSNKARDAGSSRQLWALSIALLKENIGQLDYEFRV